MASSSLRIGVSELRRRPGNRTEVRREVPIDGLAISSAAVPDGAEAVVEVTLESLTDGVTVTGHVRAPWEGECRRCLEATSGELDAPIDEVYKDDPDEGETLPVAGDAVDLGPVVHDALVLALPLAPLCRPDCVGPQPDEFPVATSEGGSDADPDSGEAGEDGGQDRPVDPRWAALSELRFDSDPSE